MTDFPLPPDRPPGDTPSPSTWGQAPTPSPFGPQSGSTPRQQRPDRRPSDHRSAPVGHVGAYPRSSKATLALVLSIVGLTGCGIISAPIGLILGTMELRAIDDGLTDPERRGTARTAVVLGAIGTILILAVILLWVVFVFLAVTNETPPN